MNAIAQVSAAPVSGPKLDNRRVAAAIIDLVIVSVGAVAILVAGDSLSGERQGALTAVILGWALYYFFALESGGGQTVGKKVMKLRVLRADGRPAGMGEIAVRTILRVIDNYLVGMIVMLATGEKRQRIGDLAAGTIVVDASGPAVASPAPAAVAEPEVDDGEDDGHDEEADAGDAEADPVATQTITLPSRPTRPATLEDLGEPEDEPAAEEAPAAIAEEPAAEVEPVIEEPVEIEPAVEAEPVAEEPVVEVEQIAEEPVVEVEPVIEEPAAEVEPDLPPVASPAIEELAQDVAAAHVEPEADVELEDEAGDDEPVNVKSVETVSAIDLVMGGVEEHVSESASESSQDFEDPASA
jgi:uncharacterized RDD family membrane protein YckC